MEVQAIVDSLSSSGNASSSSLVEVEGKILHLIQLCDGQEANAVKLGRCGGLECLAGLVCKGNATTATEGLVKKIFQLYEVIFSFRNVCLEFINWVEEKSTDMKLFSVSLMLDAISKYKGDLPILGLRLFVTIIKSIPLISNPAINVDDVTQNSLFLSESVLSLMFKPLILGMLHSDFSAKKLSMDILSNFVGELEDFMTVTPEPDIKMESMVERKIRVMKFNLIKQRSKRVADCFFKFGHIETFKHIFQSSRSNIEKQCTQICLGKVVQPLDSEKVKDYVKDYVVHGSSQCKDWDQVIDFENSFVFTKPDVSIWAIESNGGVGHIVNQFSHVEGISSSISADLLCNLTNSEDGFALVFPLIESGLFNVIMDSKSSHLKATAAAAISKSLIKSKGDKTMAKEESLKLFAAMIEIITDYEISSSTEAEAAQLLPSFSKVDSVFKASSSSSSGGSSGAKVLNKSEIDFKFDLGAQRVSLEKAIEVIASLIIQDAIKQLLVSTNKKMSGALKKLSLIAKDIDVQSTAAFGLSYILANLTVTNKELQRKALAQSEMTEEQYEQLKALEAVHTNKAESKTSDDKVSTDTQEQCDARIRRIVESGAVVGLLRLLSSGSPQTKEQCARALSQICTVVSIRGIVIQHGALKSLAILSLDEKISKATRIKLVHSIAKLLVTTNPNVLDDQLRLSCISPLLFLIREVESSNLQQFEALLSITNLISCGEPEVNLFVHLKGIPAVHYLMFSDHIMVRRAATEAFCNMAAHEEFLKLIRNAEKLKLWVKFSMPESESAYPDVESDEFALIRAATGTLAMACGDPDVCKLLIASDDIGQSLTFHITSPHEELIHRSLVTVGTMIDGPESKNCILYFKRLNVLTIILSLSKSKSSLAPLAKEILTLVK